MDVELDVEVDVEELDVEELDVEVPGRGGSGETCACAVATIDCTTGLVHSFGKAMAEATTPLPATTPFKTWRRASERAGKGATSGTAFRSLDFRGRDDFFDLRAISIQHRTRKMSESIRIRQIDTGQSR